MKKKGQSVSGKWIMAIVCIILLLAVFFRMQAVENRRYSDPVLDLGQDFSQRTLYKSPGTTDAITATCTPSVIEKTPATLTVVIENQGEAISWSSVQESRLEKWNDGDWYGPQPDDSDDAAEIANVLDEGASETYTYKIKRPSPSGRYRLLYLFSTEWCSVEFTVK